LDTLPVKIEAMPKMLSNAKNAKCRAQGGKKFLKIVGDGRDQNWFLELPQPTASS